MWRIASALLTYAMTDDGLPVKDANAYRVAISPSRTDRLLSSVIESPSRNRSGGVPAFSS